MADLATTTDIVDTWRVLSDDEIDGARAQLKFASAIVRRAVPDIDARIAAGTLDPDLVVGVVVAMVLRVLRNPEGKRQESIEDYSYLRDSTVAGGRLYLDATELELLEPVPTVRRRGAFSITPGYPAPDLAVDAAVAAQRVRYAGDGYRYPSGSR